MKKLGVVFLVLLVVSAAVQAQATGQPSPSLGEIARRARAEKENTKKATRVFDSESLSKGGSAGISILDKPAPPEESPPKAAAKSETIDAEKEWRAKFAGLRGRLKLAETALKMLKDAKERYIAASAPNSAAVIPYFYEPELVKKFDLEIAPRQAEVDKLKKVLEDLEESLRRKRLPAGWANPT